VNDVHRLVGSSAPVGAPSYSGRVTSKLTEYIEAGKALDADEREIAALFSRWMSRSKPKSTPPGTRRSTGDLTS
jgi:hypothetical protein